MAGVEGKFWSCANERNSKEGSLATAASAKTAE